MLPFSNNLRRGDRVRETKLNRDGTVVMQPRRSSIKAMVALDGLSGARQFHLQSLRLLVNGVPEDVPPFDGELPAGAAVKAPATVGLSGARPAAAGAEPRDAEQREMTLLEKVTKYEARSQPIQAPAVTLKDGEHLKSYVISYIDQKGVFHCERVSAKGIVTAITLFYIAHEETAIVSVVCVL